MPYDYDEYPPLPGADNYMESKPRVAPATKQQPAPPPRVAPVPEQQPVPPPPRGAPLHLVMVLSTMHDPVQRQLLIDTYEEMVPGLSRELFGRVGAYISAILDHHIGRTVLHSDELPSIAGAMRQILQEYGEALLSHKKAAAPLNLEMQKGQMEMMAQVLVAETRNIVSQEVDRAVAAASATQGRNLKISLGVAFLLGIILASLFSHYF